MVVELQHHFGRPLSNEPRISKDLYVVEDEGLVPGWIQRRPQLLRRLAEVQEGNVGVRICEWKKMNTITSLFQTSFETIFHYFNILKNKYK